MRSQVFEDHLYGWRVGRKEYAIYHNGPRGAGKAQAM